MSFLVFSLFSVTYLFPCMFLVSKTFKCSSVLMDSKRIGSQGTDGVACRVDIEKVSSSVLIYRDTKLYLDEDIKIKWQEVNKTFTDTLRMTSKTIKCT